MSKQQFQGRDTEWIAAWVLMQVRSYGGRPLPPASVLDEMEHAVGVLQDRASFALKRGEIFEGSINGGTYWLKLWADPAVEPFGIGYELTDLGSSSPLAGIPAVMPPATASTPTASKDDTPVTRTCADCPSFIRADDHRRQIEVTGKALGIAWCATRQMPLGSQNMDTLRTAKVLTAAAASCDHFGESPDKTAGSISFTTLGSGTVPDGPLEPTPDELRPASCSACRFHVAQSTMLTQLGLPLAGCSYFGGVILPGKEIPLAKSCSLGVTDFAASATMNNLELHAPYRDALTVIRIEPDDAALDPVTVGEPSTYPTDAPVTGEDTAAGIRAWRRIADPDDAQRSVLMPIFDRSRFDEIEAAKIPATGGDERPELYRDHQGILYKALVLWRHLGETPALSGQPGTGKTEFFRYAAWMMQLPFERISVTGSTEVDDLQGRFVLEGGETRFHYGRVPAAWQRPCVIVIDEPNVGPPEVWQFLRPLTDNSKQLVVDANKGERIDRNAHCFMGMAFNPSWDMRNAGTHEISDADGSRLMHIAVPPPDEKLERSIIAERCRADGYTIPKPTLESIIKIAADVRALASEDAFPIHWGTRQQIKVGRATQWFTLEQAYRLAAGDLIDPESCEQLMMIVKSHQGRPKTKDTKKKYADGSVPF